SISPPMANAPEGYHGYWIEDFFDVEEEFGTIDDLKELVQEAHDRDIKVFMELVTNYAAKSSPLVQDESKRDWFKEVEATPVDSTNWLDEVVQFDQDNAEVEQYLLDVANYWIDETEIDGYILHAADQSSTNFLDTLTEEVKANYPNFYLIANSLPGENIEALCSNEHIDAIAHEALLEKFHEVFAHVDTPVSELYKITEQTDC